MSLVIAAKDSVHSRQVTGPLIFEPVQNLLIDAKVNGRFAYGNIRLRRFPKGVGNVARSRVWPRREYFTPRLHFV